MADQQAQCHGCGTGCKAPPVEATDLEMKETPYGVKKDEGNPTLEEQLHRSLSNSSSSSDEEEGEEQKQKRKSKKKAEGQVCDGEGKAATGHDGCVDDPEEKKGFLEKIKEKLPGHEKKPEGDSEKKTGEDSSPPEHEAPAEKKGILEKIKEKLPGCHKNGEDDKCKDN